MWRRIGELVAIKNQWNGINMLFITIWDCENCLCSAVYFLRHCTTVRKQPWNWLISVIDPYQDRHSEQDTITSNPSPFSCLNSPLSHLKYLVSSFMLLQEWVSGGGGAKGLICSGFNYPGNSSSIFSIGNHKSTKLRWSLIPFLYWWCVFPYLPSLWHKTYKILRRITVTSSIWRATLGNYLKANIWTT